MHFYANKHIQYLGNETRTDVVGDVVAVAEPPGGDGAREVDAVVGMVGPVDGRPQQVVVVADVQYRGPEHVHRRWPTAGGDDGADEHYLHRYHKAQQKTPLHRRCRPTYLQAAACNCEPTAFYIYEK